MNDCIFCKIINKELTCNMVYENEDIIIITDATPVCDGHLLVIPKKHYNNIFELDDIMLKKLYDAAKIGFEKVKKVNNFDGASFIFNYGIPQSVKHVHLHIIPDIKGSPTMTPEEFYKLLK